MINTHTPHWFLLNTMMSNNNIHIQINTFMFMYMCTHVNWNAWRVQVRWEYKDIRVYIYIHTHTYRVHLLLTTQVRNDSNQCELRIANCELRIMNYEGKKKNISSEAITDARASSSVAAACQPLLGRCCQFYSQKANDRAQCNRSSHSSCIWPVAACCKTQTN